ncbi:MAG: DNA cytosine methyltransferase [Pseudomonadota bacterium]
MPVVIELFAGAGGASLGIAQALPGVTAVGVEYDQWACATRAAAGLLTIRADVSLMATGPMVGKVAGVWGSPPCPTFSTAGTGSGIGLLELLAEGMERLCKGDDCRAEIRSRCYPIVHAQTVAENAAKRVDRRRTPEQVEIEAHRRTAESCLVLEPARFAHDLRPGWVACEQVPAVLPLWEAMGAGLERLGYGWWAGVLDTADQGVPQNRKRAILMARYGARQVLPPPPTHFDQRRSPSLFGESWVSMADALDWGMTERPYVTVATGHLDAAGVGGSASRAMLTKEAGGGIGSPASEHAPRPEPTV